MNNWITADNSQHTNYQLFLEYLYLNHASRENVCSSIFPNVMEWIRLDTATDAEKTPAGRCNVLGCSILTPNQSLLFFGGRSDASRPETGEVLAYDLSKMQCSKAKTTAMINSLFRFI